MSPCGWVCWVTLRRWIDLGGREIAGLLRGPLAGAVGAVVVDEANKIKCWWHQKGTAAPGTGSHEGQECRRREALWGGSSGGERHSAGDGDDTATGVVDPQVARGSARHLSMIRALSIPLLSVEQLEWRGR